MLNLTQDQAENIRELAAIVGSIMEGNPDAKVSCALVVLTTGESVYAKPEERDA